VTSVAVSPQGRLLAAVITLLLLLFLAFQTKPC